MGYEDIAKRRIRVQANGPRRVRTASYFLGLMAARNLSAACQFSDSPARFPSSRELDALGIENTLEVAAGTGHAVETPARRSDTQKWAQFAGEES